MNKLLRAFMVRAVLLFASLAFALTLIVGSVSAHITNVTHTTYPQGQYLHSDRMFRGGYFDMADGGGDYLLSPNHRYQLIFQADGNLVEYDLGRGNRVVWASGTNGKGAIIAKMQHDGNFVIYTAHCAVWATGTNINNDPAYAIVIRDSGLTVMEDPYGNVLTFSPLLGSARRCLIEPK